MKTGKLTAAILAMMIVVTLAPRSSQSRPEFAQLTGNPCSACHVSPQGGGALKPEGKEFKENLENLDIDIDPSIRISTGLRLLHITLYLVHIPFGVAWVGLFLYAFGPALRRRKQVLPPSSYTRRIMASAAVVIVSGPLLVLTRMRMTPGLFSTRFGLLLLFKIVAVGTLFTATAALLWHIKIQLAGRYRRLAKALDSGKDLELVPDDLLLFDGSEKRKALVAMDGRIFDVTGRNLWRRGIHPGGHHAGHDLTGDFGKAPHGKEVFDRVTPVGRMADPDPSARKGPFSWAILPGIAASGIILLVVALWRW